MCIPLAVFAQDDFSFVEESEQEIPVDVDVIKSVSDSAFLWFDGSWCYVKLKYSVDTNQLQSISSSSKMALGDVVTTSSYMLKWSVYKDKTLLKTKDVSMCKVSSNNTKISFRYSGMLAPTNNFAFKKMCKKGDLLVLFIPTKTGGKKEYFKLSNVKL